ncbi:MAG: ABC transporter ATP-binding protein [Deltaproteobacteria bacterium]|nr:ABC transporter ATP-binding protein [Deltaproteobacteria bacterium]
MSNNLSAELTSQELADDIAVSVENITVAYRSYKQRPTSLKENLIAFLNTGKLRYYSTFDALSDVSFQVKKGQIFGVIGSNGAGKSTLLRTIVGVLRPVTGQIRANGSVDSLIQLGAGFDPELNAIENIYLNGSLHCLSYEEITERIPRIIEFAELEEFALTPIKYYSSGMFARLGFAAAIDKDPDILIVDEVLAVGDERFRKKCNAVFDSFIARGKTIVTVSHNLNYLRDNAHIIALLRKGKLLFVGDPKEALALYSSDSYQSAA